MRTRLRYNWQDIPANRAPAAAAWAVLVSLGSHSRHEFWSANFSYT